MTLIPQSHNSCNRFYFYCFCCFYLVKLVKQCLKTSATNLLTALLNYNYLTVHKNALVAINSIGNYPLISFDYHNEMFSLYINIIFLCCLRPQN